MFYGNSADQASSVIVRRMMFPWPVVTRTLRLTLQDDLNDKNVVAKLDAIGMSASKKYNLDSLFLSKRHNNFGGTCYVH